MERRCDAKVKAEIEALMACKFFVPARTDAGDDLHGAISAAVAALMFQLTIDLAYAVTSWKEPNFVEHYRIQASLWLAGEREQTVSSEMACFIPPARGSDTARDQSKPLLRKFWGWRLRRR